jgi:hypothetical protein
MSTKHTTPCECKARYQVREVRGMCLGAGGFEVVDTQDGSAWGLTLWRDEAEKTAARWNAKDQAEAA